MNVDLQRLGKLRRMTRLASDDGFFLVAAMDHPENYLELFDKDISLVPHATVVESKMELLAALSRHASAVLVDPMWSLGQGVATRTLPGGVGMIAPIEQLSYTPTGWGLETRLRPQWTVEKIAALGADGVKLFLFYRAELADVAEGQRKLVAELAVQCEHWQVPLIVEPIWYPLEGEDPGDPAVQRARATAIAASAAEFARLGVDILKMQFPGSAQACEELDSAAGGVPWVLLSEGAGYADFEQQMEIAARAGASGYIAGRAVWGDAVGPLSDAEALPRAQKRLVSLNEIVRRHGRPWRDAVPVGEVAEAMPATWYESFRR
ncbi:hypothetical protein [Allorhizocola rhizosphaerae]|uniref:hypothetical protein n=1 Tax=Allorhizocola rhizosphaerae TaxID=1872709 RepID=UPI000E3BD2DC|nr:hypothetical protein [Allorhizocola rhizosphaerae]